MPTNWDEPIIAGVTRVKADHINELRDAIDDGLDASGLDDYNWTGTITAGGVAILARHIVEMRSATQYLWSAKRLGLLPSWSGPHGPSAGKPILASHLNDLRTWVNAYENSANQPADPQGVVSHSFIPERLDDEGVVHAARMIDANWCKDASDLKKDIGKTNPVPLRLRTLVQSRHNSSSDNDITGQISQYITAFNKWQSIWLSEKGQSINIGVVLPGEFHRAETLPPPSGQSRFPYWCPNRYLEDQGDGGPYANPYIMSFAERAASFVAAVASARVKTVWIWNESNLLTNNVQPNQNCATETEWGDAQNSLGPEVFGSLSHRTALAIKSALAAINVTDVMIYAGSLSVLRDYDPTGSNAAGYLERMYKWLNGGSEEVPSDTLPYAWDGLSLNVLGPNVNGTYITSVFDAIDSVKTKWKDTKPIIIGEWGAGFPQNGSQLTYAQAETIFNAVRSKFITMYFYSHPEHKQTEINGNTTVWGARKDTEFGDIEPIPDNQGGKLDWYDHLTALYKLPGVD